MAERTNCGSENGITARVHSQGSAYPSLSPGKLRLYGMRFCPFVHRVRLVLHHKNIPHEFVVIDLKNKPDWFLQKSPSGKVPVLEFDDKLLYESDVCCDYLDEAHAQNKLVPDDPYLRAQLKLQRVPFNDVGRCIFMMTLGNGAGAEIITKAQEALRVYEDLLKTQDYFGGSAVGMLDFHLYPWFERIPTKESTTRLLDDFPRLQEWASRMSQVPAVQAVAHDVETHRQFYEATKSGKTGSDLYDIGL